MKKAIALIIILYNKLIVSHRDTLLMEINSEWNWRNTAKIDRS